MKIKAIIFALGLVLSLLIASCSSSKTCPAYGKVSQQQEDSRG